MFVVGEVKQSIYGFRDANVGLFLKAREEGFNGVVPEPLELLCNFRSAAGVVDWVNDTFREAFPAEDNVRRGRVSFTPAIAVKSAGREPAVETHAFRGDGAAAQEAEFLAERIAKFKIPERVWFLNESLPRNANGKFVKRDLKESLLGG